MIFLCRSAKLMNRIVYCIIWLLCFVRIGIMMNGWSPDDATLSVKTTKIDRIKTIEKRLAPSNARRLTSLRDAVARLVATYISPETFRPTVIRDIRKRRKKYNKPYATSRTTKLTTKGDYKAKEYWPSMKQRRDVMYSHLLKVLSKDDEEKMSRLRNGTVNFGKGGKCYLKTFSHFMKHCHYDYFLLGGVTNMKKLLGQACLANWLNTNKIIRVLDGCCQARFRFQLFDNL